CVLPSLTAPTPLQLSLRIHLYRKLLGDYAREELRSLSIVGIDDLVALAVRSIQHLGFT
ncbi:MAG: hypothetical protein FD143_3264, partial [Ignavibacteria bacterium]